MDQFEPEFPDYLICIQTDFGITSFKSLASALPLSDRAWEQNHRADKDQSLQDHNAASSRTVNVVANVSPMTLENTPEAAAISIIWSNLSVNR